MRRMGQVLMVTGALVGVTVAGSMVLHLGVAGVPWLVNLILAKAMLAGSAGLMGAGAISVRLANRREERRLSASEDDASPELPSYRRPAE